MCRPQLGALGVEEILTPVAALRWRHNERDSVWKHQPHNCLLDRLFRRRSKKTSKLRVTGLCAGNSPGAGEFPAQMASSAENVSIWWRHHGLTEYPMCACRCVAQICYPATASAVGFTIKLNLHHGIWITYFLRCIQYYSFTFFIEVPTQPVWHL